MRLRPLLLPILCLAALRAQEPAVPSFPKPGPEMAKLQPLVGIWKVEETMEPGPMGPGGKGHGISTVTLGPGGLSLHISYVSEKGPLPGYKGEGFLAWDAESKTYKQVWVDNTAPYLSTAKGHWEGDVFVVETEGTMGGKPFKSRDRLTGISANGYTITSEMSLGGGPMAKVMTLVHTRK